MGKNSITNSLRSILRKFEVVEIVDLVTIAQKLLLIWRKKKKRKKEGEEGGGKRIEDCFAKIYRGSSIWGETNSDEGGGEGGIDWTECQCQVWLILLDTGRLLFARSPIDGRVPHGAKPFLPGAI